MVPTIQCTSMPYGFFFLKLDLSFKMISFSFEKNQQNDAFEV